MNTKELEYKHYVPNGPVVQSQITEQDAIEFIDLCNSEEVGYMHPKTMLKKTVFHELVKFTRSYSKALVVAMYACMYEQRASVLSGKQNINTLFSSLMLQITSTFPHVTNIFSRTHNHQPTLLFHMFEKYLSNPHTSDCTFEFLEWMEKQPFKALSTFIHEKHDILLSDSSKACAFIMETFDPSAQSSDPPSKPITKKEEPPVKKIPSINIEACTNINSPRLDFRWLQHVPDFGLTFTCSSIDEASELIQFAAHLRAKYSAADLVD